MRHDYTSNFGCRIYLKKVSAAPAQLNSFSTLIGKIVLSGSVIKRFMKFHP